MTLFKTRLRVLRAERESTQAELAAYVGVTRQTINSIEKGRFHPNLRLAFKIASIFGKRIADVFRYPTQFRCIIAALSKAIETAEDRVLEVLPDNNVGAFLLDEVS
jgi:putative transcriptional regulator